ncbi:MAG: HAD family hydrolase [Gammaproteobacteria bacterium]
MRIIDNKYYLIDLDGVVLDNSYDNYFWQKHIPRVYAQKKAIDEKDAIRVTHSLFNYKKKTKDWYDVIYWSNLLDIDIIHEKKKSENMSLIKLLEGSLDILERLSNLDKKLFLVTNAHRKTLEIKLSKFDLSKYFDELICSHELGYVKEDIQFWHLLRNKLQIDYNDSVLIEDTFDNIISAHNAGVSNFVYINNEKKDLGKIKPLILESLSELASSM